ncbi:MAG: deoxyribonuclease V [Myxococcota bacterium]|jgi:deoxyribonuclease V
MRPVRDLCLPTDPDAFRDAQQRLAEAVDLRPSDAVPRRWAAADVAYTKEGPDLASAVAIIMSVDDHAILEEATWQGPPPHGYVPGLFALREGACLLAVLSQLQQRPDVIFVDGHGIAHPRGFGLACQVGLAFDVPTVGVAKRRLYGHGDMPDDEPGSWRPITHEEDGHTIGAVLRTSEGVKPVFVSPGHRCDVETAVRWAAAALGSYRILAPIRAADIRTRLLRDGDV